MSRNRDEYLRQGRAAAENVREEVTRRTARNEDAIKNTIGKVAGFLDQRTSGKYSGRLDRARRRLEDRVGKVADEGRRGRGRPET